MANENLDPSNTPNADSNNWHDVTRRSLLSGEVISQKEGYQYQSWGPVTDDSVVVLNVPDGKNTVTVLQYITEQADAAARKAATQDGLLKSISQQQSGNRSERRRQQKEGAGAENNTTMQMHFDQGAYEVILLSHMVKAWTFRNADGQMIPISRNSISVLPIHTRDWLLGAIDDMNPKYDETLPKEEDDEPEFSRSGHRTSPLDERMIGSS